VTSQKQLLQWSRHTTKGKVQSLAGATQRWRAHTYYATNLLPLRGLQYVLRHRRHEAGTPFLANSPRATSRLGVSTRARRKSNASKNALGNTCQIKVYWVSYLRLCKIRP
jgi:hypothetical protein